MEEQFVALNLVEPNADATSDLRLNCNNSRLNGPNSVNRETSLVYPLIQSQLTASRMKILVQERKLAVNCLLLRVCLVRKVEWNGIRT